MTVGVEALQQHSRGSATSARAIAVPKMGQGSPSATLGLALWPASFRFGFRTHFLRPAHRLTSCREAFLQRVHDVHYRSGPERAATRLILPRAPESSRPSAPVTVRGTCRGISPARTWRPVPISIDAFLRLEYAPASSWPSPKLAMHALSSGGQSANPELNDRTFCSGRKSRRRNARSCAW
jgi:hypothetical protein